MAKKTQTQQQIADIAALPIDKLLSVALFVPMGDPNSDRPNWGLPILFWGPPGISKTTQCLNYHRQIKLPFRAIIAATRLPEDFGGAPVPDGKGGLNMVPTLPMLKELAGQSGTVFFDELGNAPMTVMGALLDAIQTKRVGDLDLGGHVRMVAASNRPEDGLGRELLPALANRFAHYDFAPPSASAWIAWLQGASVQEATLSFKEYEMRVQKGWNDAFARASGISAGFIQSMPDRLYDMPKQGNPQRGRAWPSHRTWEMATRVAAACEALGVEDDVRDAIMAGTVGSGPAGEWAEWASKADIPSPYDVLNGKWEPDRERLDISVAVLTSVASTVVTQTDKKKQEGFAVNAWHFFKRVLDKKGMDDLVVGPAQVLVKAGLSNISKGGPLAKAAVPVLNAMSHNGLADLVNASAADA